MDTGLLLAFFLVVLGFIWGFWLIFKDKVKATQPMGVIMYFVGAVLAVLIASFVTVRVFPGIAVRFLDMADTSQDVDTLGEKAGEIFQGTTGLPAATRTPVQPQPAAPVSPVASPGGQSLQSAATSVPGQEHTVQLGETLYSISRKYGVSVAALQAANNLANPDNIKAGQKLIIPK
ncbi:MAG: LysM peptidoglycan-binding domain-containing protein [Thermoflexales bacterium]|nr:LysM peptidoglycan-binding domain-containing protein [Thermoflexales bacterium]